MKQKQKLHLHPQYIYMNYPTINPTIDPTKNPTIDPTNDPTIHPTNHQTIHLTTNYLMMIHII